jgi:low affinity Fe/Cu permease
MTPRHFLIQMRLLGANMDDASHRNDRHASTDHFGNATFSAIAQWASRQCGRASTFIVACLAIVIWAITGPIFAYSDTWQLVINTGTTIVTFLMVFLIQNTQNRDMSALQLKLDELIRVNQDARNKLLDLEDLTEAELEQLKGTFSKLAGSPPDADRVPGTAADADQVDEDAEPARQPAATP